MYSCAHNRRRARSPARPNAAARCMAASSDRSLHCRSPSANGSRMTLPCGHTKWPESPRIVALCAAFDTKLPQSPRRMQNAQRITHLPRRPPRCPARIDPARPPRKPHATVQILSAQSSSTPAAVLCMSWRAWEIRGDAHREATAFHLPLPRPWGVLDFPPPPSPLSLVVLQVSHGLQLQSLLRTSTAAVCPPRSPSSHRPTNLSFPVNALPPSRPSRPQPLPEGPHRKAVSQPSKAVVA